MSKQSDRDRVLMNIAVDTSGKIWDDMTRVPGHSFRLRTRFGCIVPQFIDRTHVEHLGMPLEIGDIVRCQTNPDHRYGISEYIGESEDPHGRWKNWHLRAIGGDDWIRMGNEEIDVLRFMAPHRLYTGKKWQLYQWAYKAFKDRWNQKADYYKRCGGVEFDGDRMHIWMRAHAWALIKTDESGLNTYAQPKKFTVHWNNKTRLKDLVNSMLEQGFDEDFEYSPEESREGNAGITMITRDDLVSALELSGISLK